MQDIRDEAIAAYPHEAVWLITKAGTKRVDNTHEDPENFFRVSLQDTIAATREGLLSVVHSHCDGWAVPSAEDMHAQALSGVPWGVLSTDGNTASEITWWGEDAVPPLEGRGFVHGVSDCYSLVRDYYRLKGIVLDEVPRNWQWWDTDQNLIVDQFELLGFKQVPLNDVQEGDTWVSQVRNKSPHHCGIVLANDLILHHPGAGDPIDNSKMSIIEPIYRYLPYIAMFLRLK